MFVIVSACSLGPPKAQQGMALIDGAYVRGDGHNTFIGRIYTVKNEETGKKLKISPYSHQLDVAPGKYTVQYLCHTQSVRNYKEYAKNNPQLVETETVTLQEGQILYVRSEIKHGSNRPSWCKAELRITKSK